MNRRAHFPIAIASIVVSTQLGLAQSHQADLVKQRAKEVVNQNNVRQGVPSPAAAPAPAAPTMQPAVSRAVSQTQTLSNLTKDLEQFKAGKPVDAADKARFETHVIQAARTRKADPAATKQFVDSLTSALGTATLTTEQQARLAQNIDAVLNARTLSTSQFDQVIEDTKAILMVGSVKRTAAVAAANDLKVIGTKIKH